jgi:hypothetical protein
LRRKLGLQPPATRRAFVAANHSQPAPTHFDLAQIPAIESII